eukprot:1421752-Amphidinium_carterae.2
MSLYNLLGTINASVSGKIAATLQTTPFYNQLLEEYVKTIPSALQFNDKLVTMRMDLARMAESKIGMGDIGNLNQIIDDLPVLMTALRSGAVDDIMMNAKHMLAKMVELTEGEKRLSVEQWKSMSALCVHASVVWPQISWIQGYMMKAGEMVHKTGMEQVVADIQKAVAALTSANIGFLGYRLKDMEQLGQQLTSATLDRSLLLDNGEGPWLALQDKTLEICCFHWPEGQEIAGSQVAEGVDYLNQALAKSFTGTAIEKKACAFHTGMDMMMSHVTMKSRVEQPENVKDTMQDCQTLQRLLMQYQKMVSDSTEIYVHDVFKRMSEYQAKASNGFDIVIKSMLTKSREKTAALEIDLKEVSGGLGH